jgi:hypothetical protein
MATIFYWGTNESGHVSIEAAGVYRSLHPRGGKKAVYSSVWQDAEFVDSLDYDIYEKFGGAKPKSRLVRNVNDELVSQRALELSQNQKHYQYLTSNCSHFVAACMSYGIIEPIDDDSLMGKIHHLFSQIKPDMVTDVGHIDVLSDFISNKLGELGYMASKAKGPVSRLAIFSLIGGATINHLLIESPADVIRLADKIDHR